jgi:hypothetical protein
MEGLGVSVSNVTFKDDERDTFAFMLQVCASTG